MSRKFWGIVLVALGILALLQGTGQYNFGLQFWDVLVTLVGGSILWGSMERTRWFGIAIGLWITGIGMIPILERAGLNLGITSHDLLIRGWPILLVAAGVSLIFGKHSWIQIQMGRGEWKHQHGSRYHSETKVVGDMRYGSGSWVLDKDLDLTHGVGDVRVDLTTAQITDGTHTVRVSGWIGDLVVRVPDNVSVTVNAHTGIGDLEVLGEYRSGLGNTVNHKKVVPDSPVELIIDAHLGIGDLRVMEGPSTTRLS